MTSQLLSGLTGLGHTVEAIAPITEDVLRAGDPLGGRGDDIEVSRFVVPYLDNTSETPPSNDYRRCERQQIEELVTRSIERHKPDVLVIGRESFAEHVVDLACLHFIPSVLLVHGSTTFGILNGSYPAKLAERLLQRFREVDVVVTSAQHMQSTLAQLDVRNVEVIPNPVDLDRFHPDAASPGLRRALSVREDDLVVAHASNLKALKRPLDIVRAAEIALAEDNGLVFVILGDGPCRVELEEECAARHLRRRFRFAGWVAHERMPAAIASADIVVMPSAGEAQALVYLETQASGRALLASDIPAAREVIEHGRSGLLFDTGDIPGLAAAVLTAARDPELRTKLGRQARQRVWRHSLPRVAAAYAELLESVISRRPGDVTTQPAYALRRDS
jgi:glycosyltransferase involved in cell wall biosynthesis